MKLSRTFRLDPLHVRMLKAEKKASGLSQSGIVRQAIELYVNRAMIERLSKIAHGKE